MPIVIKPCDDGLREEYAFIELQGDLKSHSETAFDGKFVGDLHFSKSGTPLLIIGHHLMYGKETKLDKPFALLEKCQEDGNVTYKVRCVVKNKIIFKTRPKPIVGA
ncbi:chromosome transmission fidelity protein 8 homolog [Sitophilus oryzae]|uniref:Chromosome transmission fidelity protein 8 homolog n=1 Tax=Sitophilus oryzae TaxID=7048 RepID=A0A6J2YRE4_SITOR|nr:chromosome transmission fidelity protein 8 homolog [Sitophilus oryzae]